MHHGGNVREDRGSRVGEAVEDLDDAAVLGHEDPTIRGELYFRRHVQAAEDDLLLESGRHGARTGLGRRQGDENASRCCRRDKAPHYTSRY
jgi:hypothetical protein